MPAATTSQPTSVALPAPKYELHPSPDGSSSYLLEVELPKVVKSSDVDLALSEEQVEVEAPGAYAKLCVPLPKHPKVLEKKAKASWDTKRSRLRITLPHE